ncbi:MAG: hypothetical protein U0R66_03280 [Mycobacterium sp.]
MANIKNLTTVAASTAALITLAVAGMPQASASTLAPAMEGKYNMAYSGGGGQYMTIKTECSAPGLCDIQHVTLQLEPLPLTAHRTDDDKWTMSVHHSQGYFPPCAPRGVPSTFTWTYDSSGGVFQNVPDDPKACGGSPTQTSSFTLGLSQ